MSHRTHARAASSARIFNVALGDSGTIEGLENADLHLSKEQERQIRSLRKAFRSVK